MPFSLLAPALALALALAILALARPAAAAAALVLVQEELLDGSARIGLIAAAAAVVVVLLFLPFYMLFGRRLIKRMRRSWCR